MNSLAARFSIWARWIGVREKAEVDVLEGTMGALVQSALPVLIEEIERPPERYPGPDREPLHEYAEDDPGRAEKRFHVAVLEIHEVRDEEKEKRRAPHHASG